MKKRTITRFLSISFALGLLFSAELQAQTPETRVTVAKLDEATVYFHGAELSHSATVSLNRGENEITIKGLSTKLDLNSLKIKASGGVVVSAYEFSVDFLADKTPKTSTKRLEDSLKIYRAMLNDATSDKTINDNMIQLILTGMNASVSSENGIETESLIQGLEYYKSRTKELRTEQYELEERISKLQTHVQRLSSQIQQESLKGGKLSGELKLTLSSPVAGSSNFTVSYFTDAAQWTPYYDINIASVSSPVSITGRAKIRQTTGLDWERIKLSLSTATPTDGKTAPLFTAWFLQQQAAPRSPSNTIAAQNRYSYDVMEEASYVDEVVVSAYGNLKKSSTAVLPPVLYIVDGEIVPASYAQSIDQSFIRDYQQLNAPQAQALYGDIAAGGAVIITLKSSMDDYINVSDNELNMVFNIDLPYTIPGNGKEQNIDLLTRETSAEYKYYTAPKLDPEMYILAEIPSWESLGLLSGQANITFDGTHMGNIFIDASSTNAKLTLTLGSDRRVAVKREKLKDFSSTRTIGNDLTQVFSYKITIKNNRNTSVDYVVKDQYPLSTNKNIVVEFNEKETTGWTANIQELGVISWEGILAPGESKEFRISYSVKYPKNMRLNL